MERRSLFCRDIIKGFALLTDVFFLLLEHMEIMQIIINCHVMNSPVSQKWGQYDLKEMNWSQSHKLSRMCAEYIPMQSSFVIFSLSHISIELSGTDMWERLKQTSAHTCTHMYKHTQADIHAHARPVGAQTLGIQKNQGETKECKREFTVGVDWIKTRRKRNRKKERDCVCVCGGGACVRACVCVWGRATWR